MNNIKMIVGDLDDTILNGKKHVSNKMIEVRSRLQNKGVLFTIATARSCDAARQYIEDLSPDYVISCDGGLISTRNKILQSNSLSSVQFNKLYSLIRDNNNIGRISIVSLYRDYKNYKGEKLPQDFDSDIIKVICEIHSDDQLRILQEKNADLLLSYYDRELWVRFSNKKATKFVALSQLCEISGIQLNQIMAFGDDFNDIEMIRNCGIGVAVSNAIQPVKDVADYIAKDNESDGVADFIAQFFNLNF